MRSAFLPSVALLILQTFHLKTTVNGLCPDVTCSSPCKPNVSPDDCSPVCACPNTCEDTECNVNEVCLSMKGECTQEPCFDIPTCLSRYEIKAKCVVPECEPDCEPKTSEEYLCPFCICPKICKDYVKQCGYEKCMLWNHICTKAPCLPLPTCVPEDDYCLAIPNQGSHCESPVQRWTYNASDNLCHRFTYHGCTPSKNTFSTLSDCQKKCKAVALVCNPDPCPEECYSFTFSLLYPKRCPVCICPNPCKNFYCDSNLECRVHEEDCTKSSCNLKPYCAEKCPEQPPCAIKCRWGLKHDKNGCTLCECIESPNDSS